MTARAPTPHADSHAAQRPLVVFVPLLLFAALAGLFLFRLFAGDASLLPSALIGRQVPDFDLPPVDGLDKRGFSAADLRQGKVTLVNVFASWCVPCHQEHQVLMQLAADPILKRTGASLFGIAYKDDPANVQRFLAENGDPFARIGADRKGRVAIDWGVYGVPETFIIKGDGTIAYRFVGPVSEEAYRQTILPEIEKAQR